MAVGGDPDAALHGAQPGKYKPASADGPPPVNPQEPGTLSEGVERLPVFTPTRPTAAPVEKEQSWGDWLNGGWDQFSSSFHAAQAVGRNDRADFGKLTMEDGYAPILDALGLPASESPWMRGENDSGLAFASQLYRKRNPNAGYLDYSTVTRPQQEELIAAEIRDRRAKDPKFLPGVPDTVAGLHAYFIANEKKKRAEGQAQLAAAPSGLGTTVASLGGELVEAMKDPVNIVTLPIGGGGKTLLGVAAREALTNGIVTAIEQPIVAKNREMIGEHLTAGEAASNVGFGAAGGAVLGSVAHVGGKLLEASGAPQAVGRVIGNLDLANTLSYKIYSAMPEALQRKWGAGIVTKWAKRLANGEKLEDVFSNLSNVELATLSRTVIGEDRLTPEERAAAEHLTRTEEVGDSSPFEPSPAGDGKHESSLEEQLRSIIDNNRPTEERPSASPLADSSGAGALPPEPARPTAATSTAARRPLEPKVRPTAFPVDIYQGLKSRGIPDHLAAGIAAGIHAESRGDIRALGPVTAATHGDRALGIGQWLGGRKAELLRRYGPSPTLEQQLDFLVWELKGGDGGGKKVLAARDEVEALHSYIKDFMRPGAGAETEKDLERGMAALGRAGEDVGELAGGSAPIDVPDDPEIARLREEALNLDDQVIGLSDKPDGSKVNAYGRRVSVRDINVDADRFQFKAGGDQYGVTDRLRGIEEFDPVAAGRVSLWERNDGKLFVANGHQRTGLATRISDQTGKDIHLDAAIWREADGVTAEDAMVMAALHNIGEDSGTVIDAAKIGRARADALEAAAKKLPPKSAMVRDARALAKLSDDAFGAVYRGDVAPDHAAVIGHLVPDKPEIHGALVDLLVKLDPANRGQAESIIRQAIAAGMHKGEQVDLFGSHEVFKSLMLERAKVLEKVLGELRKSKLLFKTAAKEADTLEAVGSKIAKSASEKEAQSHAQALELVQRLAFTHGPVGEILNDAARKLAAGAKLADVVDEAARAIRELDLGAVARETARNDSSRLLDDGAGRGGGAGEAGETVREEQPSLTDLERASERFSDPDGKAVKQQSESLEHDLKATTSRRDKIRAATAELDKTKPGELRSVEPFPEEPGYHRFRYVTEDGKAVGGNYTVDGNLIEGFNIGDVHNPVELGQAELRKLFAELHALHPEAKYVHAYRKSGARTAAGHGEEEIWMELTDKGVKLHREDPRLTATGPQKSDLGVLSEDLQAAADAADKSLTGKAAEAIDNFVGHGPMSRHKEGDAAIGRMTARDLEQALADNGDVAREIEAAFSPVRAAIEAKTGPTVKLYRVQQPVEWDPNVHYGSRGLERQRAVLSWTSDPKFADFHAGADPRLDRADIPEEKIAKLEQEFAANGEVKVNKSVTLKLEPEGYIGIYDERSGGFVTDTESVRAYLEQENAYRADYRARNAAKRDAIISAEVPLKDVVWVTDRAGQNEFIVRNEPGSGFFIDEHGRLSTDVADAAAAPSKPDVSAEQFASVWKDKEFKAAVSSMTSRGAEDIPHRESPVAHEMVRGWLDGKAGNLEQLVNEAERVLGGADQYRPHGYNPRQGYLEAYYAAATGKAREIRGLGNERTLGAREALQELAVDAVERDPAAVLDLGDKVDPAIADRQRQETQLKAASPMRATVDQQGEIGLGLFDSADQLSIELHDEAKALLDELGADDKAIDALKGCL